jgi:hypothetical protein
MVRNNKGERQKGLFVKKNKNKKARGTRGKHEKSVFVRNEKQQK